MNVTLFRDLPTERWWSMERYADELTRALQHLGCEARGYVAARPLPNLRGAANTFANYVWRSLAYPLAARFQQGEVNHIVDHSYAHLIHTLDASRTVVTCHDLAPRALNEGRGLGRWLWERSFRAMLRAARIITVSAFTRAELTYYTNYPANRIIVVPEGVNERFFKRSENSTRLRKKYGLEECFIILHVGSCQPRKNIEAIINALALLRAPDFVFVQIGGQFNTKQLVLINSLGLDKRVYQIQWVNESDLCAWYQTANVIVLPSFYEGFGLPVLEAMASGTPVICAHTSSLPEVAGDAALLVDPRNVNELADTIERVLTDHALRDTLRARGLARAQAFTWERTARETFAVYQTIR